jgi:sugar/nucleoside kinase (ribokinase family)
MVKVLGMGNALVDILIRLSDDSILKKFSLPRGTMQLVDKNFIRKILDESVSLSKSISSGGSASNTIHGLAHMGVSTAFIGKVGNDEFGRIFKLDLQGNQIQPLLFYGLDETGRAVALISADGERTFTTFLGAAIELSQDDIDSDVFKGNHYFHIEGYLVQNHHLIEKAVRLAKRNKLIVSLDLASYNVVEENRDFLKAIIEEYVDIVFANEDEARTFTGLEPEAAVSALAKDCSVAVVKIGEKGSYVMQGENLLHIPAIKAKCIDTTGAGDLYAAGFLYGLVNGKSLSACGQYGSLMAGNVIEVIGAKMDAGRWEEIKQKAEGI